MIKVYLYTKDPYEAKFQYLINKRESIGLKHFNDPKAFTEYSNDIYKMFTKLLMNTIQIKDRKMLIVFDDIIADMINNKKLNPIVTDFFRVLLIIIIDNITMY